MKWRVLMKRSTAFVAGALLAATFALAQAEAGGVHSGYKKGFYISTDDGDFSLALRLRGQIQAFSVMEDWKNETTGIRVRRARLKLSGKAFSHLNYGIQITLEGGKLSLRDLIFEWKSGPVGVKVGQFKVPAIKEYLTSSSALEFVERSVFTSYFSWGRDIGVAVVGGDSSGHVAYAVGVFNGEGKNAKPADTGALYAARIVVGTKGSVKKGVWKNSQGAFDNSLLIKAGISYLYGEFKSADSIVKRADRSKFLKGITQPAYIWQASGDIAFKLYPVAIELEGALADANLTDYAWGFRGQISTFIYRKHLQTAARFALVDWGEDVVKEVSGAISWYILGNHLFKLQNEYTYRWNGSKEFSARLQMQVYF